MAHQQLRISAWLPTGYLWECGGVGEESGLKEGEAKGEGGYQRSAGDAGQRLTAPLLSVCTRVCCGGGGGGGTGSERRAPGRAASARPLRAQAQEDPHGLLALAAAAPGARLREEPLRGGRRAEAAGRQPQPLGDAGNDRPKLAARAHLGAPVEVGAAGAGVARPSPAFPAALSCPVPEAAQRPAGAPAKPVFRAPGGFSSSPKDSLEVGSDPTPGHSQARGAAGLPVTPGRTGGHGAISALWSRPPSPAALPLPGAHAPWGAQAFPALGLCCSSRADLAEASTAR